MPFGRDEGARRQAARKHALHVHTCNTCGRKIRGNAYYLHRSKCRANANQAYHNLPRTHLPRTLWTRVLGLYN